MATNREFPSEAAFSKKSDVRFYDWKCYVMNDTFFFLICILGLLTSLLKLLLLTAGLVWGWDEQSGGRGRSWGVSYHSHSASLPSWGSSTAHCTPISSWETTGSRRGQVSPLSLLHVACPGPAGSLHFRFRSRPTRRYAYLTVGFQA